MRLAALRGHHGALLAKASAPCGPLFNTAGHVDKPLMMRRWDSGRGVPPLIPVASRAVTVVGVENPVTSARLAGVALLLAGVTPIQLT